MSHRQAPRRVGLLRAAALGRRGEVGFMKAIALVAGIPPASAFFADPAFASLKYHGNPDIKAVTS